MKICYLADGQSIHTVRWCKHFSSLGHHVELITFRPAEIEGIKVHYIDTGNISVRGGNWKVVLSVPQIKKLLNQMKPDILHAQYVTSYGLVGALTGFHPYVITALGSDVLISPQKSSFYRLIVNYALSKADWITAMADHMRDTMIKLGTHTNKVDTVIFGIDPAIFNSNDKKLPSGKFVITSSRNFEPVYNIKLLIDAINIIKDKIPNLEVNLIGAGSQREYLEDLIKQYQLETIIKFCGKVSQSILSEILQHSHLFATTSLSDGNNISLNEAMACDTFPLATDIPANRQWISDGENGFLVPTDDPQYLAEKILLVYNNYDALSIKAAKINKNIIQEKALWSVNMNNVEIKYKELAKKYD